jgi:hypothetical protein
MFTSEQRRFSSRRTLVFTMSTDLQDGAARLIPGAYDPTTLNHRQPGSMGGPAFGTDGIPRGLDSMDEATLAERRLEGGGSSQPSRRPL